MGLMKCCFVLYINVFVQCIHVFLTKYEVMCNNVISCVGYVVCTPCWVCCLYPMLGTLSVPHVGYVVCTPCWVCCLYPMLGTLSVPHVGYVVCTPCWVCCLYPMLGMLSVPMLGTCLYPMLGMLSVPHAPQQKILFKISFINDIMDKLFANINHMTPIGANCKLRLQKKYVISN